MPAVNMGKTGTGNAGVANGQAVIMSPFSGPTGSPFDNDQSGNYSTGGLNTGIGFGIGTLNDTQSPKNNFTPLCEPGVWLPGNTVAPDARLTAIGGGRSKLEDGTGANGNGTPPGTTVSVPDPYGAQPLLAFGNGVTRDAGAGPAFTGFGMKLVQASGNVAHAGVITTGWVNRVKPGYTLPTGLYAFGSGANASGPVTAEID
jgi:hypothetical protein